jgi:O-acetyl-ADP-ribose deacetylase (regulator of RNase III)
MMMTHEGAAVACNVTRDALNILFDGKGGIAAVGQLAVFDQCRDQIEAVASQKWDCSQPQVGRVVVKPEDLLKAGLA